MHQYTVKLYIKAKPEEDNLGIKTGVKSGRLPKEVSSALSELLLKMPILIRASWLVIVNKYPDSENGFDVVLSLNFKKEDDDEWYVSSHTDNTDKVDEMLLGMIKMILQEDPIIDQVIEDDLKKLDLPEYIQHFDPTC